VGVGGEALLAEVTEVARASGQDRPGPEPCPSRDAGRPRRKLGVLLTRAGGAGQV